MKIFDFIFSRKKKRNQKPRKESPSWKSSYQPRIDPLEDRCCPSGDFGFALEMGGTNDDEGNAITTDDLGNVYVTGQFQDTVDFDPGAGSTNLTSNGSGDIFISKFDSSGNLLWARNMGGTGFDRGRGISVDSAGNVYTTGYFKNTVDFDPGLGTANLTSNAGSTDIFVSKLDASGNYLWAQAMGGTASDIGRGISVDSAGNVLATGYFAGTADFDPGTATFNLSSTGVNNDIFVSKLDTSGNFLWARAMGGTSDEFGRGVSVDLAGNVYTTGSFEGTADFNPGLGTANLTSNGLKDIFVSKLDSTGNFLWARAMGGTETDAAYGISVDSAGNVYTTGLFELTVDFDPGLGTANLTSKGGFDIFVSKLDSLGNHLWSKSIGAIENDRGQGLSLDSAGNVYTTGSFRKTADFDPDLFGVSNLTSNGLGDIFVSKLDTSGNFVWARAMGGDIK